jgi:uncharacterized membrane protein
MWITLAGAAITIGLNLLWIPSQGYFSSYMGSAWATLICYASMMVVSYFMGQKHYPVPYQVQRILSYILTAVVLFFIGWFTDTGSASADLVFRNLLFGLFIAVVLITEKPFRTLIKRPGTKQSANENT